MANDDTSGGDLSAEDMGMMGIVVQGGRVAPSHPHLDFVWGPPEFKAAPSLPFGRWKPGAKAA
ncbi:hypothetical protein [Longimicrobium sp.]|uniref:hypothetical protein n=1 Tax=Longimicrobium sp. TaxID=2029185 RepID=UPI002D030700|nr:hypothetical protein [Longimicrobium sp.]HSU15772.1 hypothetical protein [Longimicrobium sp.]